MIRINMLEAVVRWNETISFQGAIDELGPLELKEFQITKLFLWFFKSKYLLVEWKLKCFYAKHWRL